MNPSELDELLGREAAGKLAAALGGERPYVPTLESWQGYLRNEDIRARWKRGETLETLAAAFPDISRKQLKRLVGRRKPAELTINMTLCKEN